MQGHPTPVAKTERAVAAVHTPSGRAAEGARTATRSVAARHRYVAPHWAAPATMLRTNEKRHRDRKKGNRRSWLRCQQ